MRIIGSGGAWIDRKRKRFFTVSEITALAPRFNNGRTVVKREARAKGRTEGEEGGKKKKRCAARECAVPRVL